MSKINFEKPTKSNLPEKSRLAVSEEELERFGIDLPVSLKRKLKVRAAQEGITMRELVLEAIIDKLAE